MTIAPDKAVDDRPMVGCPSRRHPRETMPPASGGTGPELPPRIADGVQLLGEYAGTGYEQAQYLARRPGGQLVQLSQLLHQVADECDGRRTLEQVAERVSEAYGKPVSPDNVRTLVDRLRPLGVLAAADGTSPEVQESDPLLGLKLRTQLLSPALVRRLAAVVRPVFWPPLVLAVVAALVAVDVWLFFVHGVGVGVRATVEQPVVFLLVAAVVVVSAGAARVRARRRVLLRRGQAGWHGRRHLRRLARLLHRRHRRLPARQAGPAAHRPRRASTSTP